MGVSLSFLAVKGLTSTEVHRALGITDTGVAAGEFDYPRPAMHGAALPDGWYLVLLNSVDHRFVTLEEGSRAPVARLRGGRLPGRGARDVQRLSRLEGRRHALAGGARSRPGPPPPRCRGYAACRLRRTRSADAREAGRGGSSDGANVGRFHLGDPGRARQLALPLSP